MTDRALRYRAQAHPPGGPPICALCGTGARSAQIDIGHVDGNESHGSPENLIWTCRSCNVKSGNVLRGAGIGRLTRQFNPTSSGAKSLGQWLAAVTSMNGESSSMPVADAVAMIHATPPERRSEFAQQIWRKRREHYGATGRSDSIPF